MACRVGALGSRHHKIALKIKSLLDPDCPEQKNGAASESMGEFQGEEEDSDDDNFADELEDDYRMGAESIAEHVVTAKEVISDFSLLCECIPAVFVVLSGFDAKPDFRTLFL